MGREEIAECLYDGVQAVLDGDLDHGLELLMRVVEADERNELAWLWISGAVEDPADQRTALENVRDINPNNKAAQQGLALLTSQGH